MKNKENHQLRLILVIFLATFFRLWQLGEVPSGLTNDEAAVIYNSYSIFRTGRDVTGKFLPLSFNLDNSFSPVYIYLTAPFTGILGLSPFSGRLPFALMGIGSVWLLFLITRKLFENDDLALLASFALAISPWHLQISRVAYDAPCAMFFYLLALYIFLIKIQKGNILWSLPAFLLGFYSYHGTKIFFILFIPLLLFLFRDFLRKRKKELFCFIVGVIAIVGSFFLVAKTQNITRQIVFLWSDTKSATKTVNWERAVNTAPFLVRQIFNNKALYFLRVVRENYLEVLSPQFLFLYGETGGLGGIYGTYFRGVMYIVELPLLLLGVIYFWQIKNKRSRKLLFLSILIAPLSSAFTVDKSYVMRSVMMLPFLSIFVGGGIKYLLALISQKLKSRAKSLAIVFFVLSYLFLVTGYLYQYYYRYSLYGAEAWFKSSRDLAEYVGKEKENHQEVYIANTGAMLLLQYAVFNKVNPSAIQSIWEAPWPKKIDNVSLIHLDCPDQATANSSLKKDSLLITSDECYKGATLSAFITDQGNPLRVIWRIYETK